MIEIKFKPDTFTLDITGHAEHGEKGEDIVCAAISTLFYTLAESLYAMKEYTESLDIDDTDGHGHIVCNPKEKYEANISLIFWTILNGFELVAKNYQDNVKFEQIVP